ncbi:hypothetical protein [Nonomuraea sp. NPDC049400]|uniref:hypothetical protein n=1 Tax=Nonomuraea sp. NPDC049400 TaxID=3364352 RepID=UPI0037B6BCB8
MSTLAAYRAAICLDEPFRTAAPAAGPGEHPGLARTALRLLARDPAAARLGPPLPNMSPAAQVAG